MSASSIGEQAILAAIADLAGGPTANVFRSRTDQIGLKELPCYDVTPGEEKIDDPGEYGDRNSVTRTLPIVVRAMVDAGTTNKLTPDDSVLDPFRVWAVQQLTGAGGQLGGLVLEVNESSGAVIFQPAGQSLIGLEMQFVAKWATKRGDPTQKG